MSITFDSKTNLSPNFLFPVSDEDTKRKDKQDIDVIAASRVITK